MSHRATATAASDILRMIARAPGDFNRCSIRSPSARRALDAADAVVWRVDGEFDAASLTLDRFPSPGSVGRVPDRGGPIGRAIMDRQTIHVHDLQAAAAEFPRARGTALGFRTILVTPLLHGGVAIGAIAVRRRQVRPFSDRQIKLLETFADQAVIAIENARLISGTWRKTTKLETATRNFASVGAADRHERDSAVIASYRRIFSRCWTSWQQMPPDYARHRCTDSPR